MRAYLDANVYLAYFLGEKDEELVDRLFQTSLACRFSLTASRDVYREVQRACQDRGAILIREHMGAFQKSQKLQIVHATPSDLLWASNQNIRTDRLLGLNDWIHVRLSSLHSDVLVSNDRDLLELARPWVESQTLVDFLKSL